MSGVLNYPANKIEEAAFTVLGNLANRSSRHRMLWGSVCWSITVVLLGFGIPFLVGGGQVTSVPGAYESITRYVPGGLHTYGGLMVLFGAVFAEALIQPLHRHPDGRQPMNDRQLHLALRTFIGFAVGIVIAFLASMALSGTLTWQGIVYWGALTLLAAAADVFAPDPVRRDGAA